MEDAPSLSNSQELVRPHAPRVPARREAPDDASRRYEVLVRYAAVLTVEATDYADAHSKAYGATVLAVFDHGISLIDEIVLGIREAD
jgi:hypothetical protein